jgi:protein TilB
MPTIITNRRHITLDLIRKRAEHNEGLVSNLEEIALHQEELEAIGPILGRTCGKTLRILLLQNNVIDRMDPADFKHFKRLEYLNLAINNIHNVQGIAHLEFLEKIDLTLNFIHLNSLRESLEAMVPLRSLKELHLMGNPCCLDDTKNKQGWHGYRNYVIAKLPQLQNLDGTVITRSERIRALRNLISLEQELNIILNQEVRPLIQEFECGDVEDPIQDDEPTQHCPQVRLRISHEMAAQKAEKEKLENANHPPVKGEQEAIEEQHLFMERARLRLEQGEVRQCNGKVSLK